MTRRWSTGRFRPAAPLAGAPLLAAIVRPAKSAAHVRGNATRRAAWVARRDAKTAELRRECGL